MFEFMPESEGNVVGIRATGTLTHADYEEVLIPALNERFDAHGGLRVLFYMDDSFAGWDLHAAWDDTAFGLRHRADFERIAVVGGPRWIERCIEIGALFMKGEIRTFAPDGLDEAWAWLKDRP